MFSSPTETPSMRTSIPCLRKPNALTGQLRSKHLCRNPVLLMAQNFWEYDGNQKLPQMSELLTLESKEGR